MFVYENGNSLNLTFKGSIPVENPEVVIKGFKNGASLTVNGTEVVSVPNAKEFEGKAKTFVFQRDGMLMITFKGVAGIENPEVTVNEVSKGVVDVVVNGTTVTLEHTDESVAVKGDVTPVIDEPVAPVVEPVKEDEPEVTPEEEPEEVVEE